MCAVIKDKINRLRKGAPPRVLDLFAGYGGISLGFKSDGYELRAAIELDPAAAASHADNFFPLLNEEEKAHHARSRDITTIAPPALYRRDGL